MGRGSWIGQAAFLHAAGGITIGEDVGIGPHVCILSSSHVLPSRTAAAGLPAEPSPDDELAILRRPLTFAAVTLEAGCDIGVGAILLPGVTIGRLAQVGAGAVVTASVPPRTIVAGNPARALRTI
ncbi:MAG: acyltransferase [Myxococcales bacterium]|nr:acyltransferase [Myxococcales bacterium]